MRGGDNYPDRGGWAASFSQLTFTFASVHLPPIYTLYGMTLKAVWYHWRPERFSMEEDKKDKTAARHTFEALSRSGLLERLWQFVRKPDIVGERESESGLLYAGKNCAISVLVVTSFAAFVDRLVPKLFDIDVMRIFDPFWLGMTLATQVLLFAATLAGTGSLALLPHGVRLHRLLAFQVVQVYAVLHFPTILMLGIAADRIVRFGDLRETAGTGDLLFGGALAFLVFYLAWRLLFRPVAHYMARYYRKSVAAFVAILVFGCTFAVNAYTAFGFGDLMIDREGLCRVFYEVGRENGQIELTVDEACFIGQCIVMAGNED